MKHRLIPPKPVWCHARKIDHRHSAMLAHDIQAANNHNLLTNRIIFDTTGYFSNVNHNRLLVVS